MSTLCDAGLELKCTTPAGAAVADKDSTDTALTILFGTMGLVLAALQVVLSWQSVRALRRRNVANWGYVEVFRWIQLGRRATRTLHLLYLRQNLTDPKV
jgi:hypothetical protein